MSWSKEYKQPLFDERPGLKRSANVEYGPFHILEHELVEGVDDEMDYGYYGGPPAENSDFFHVALEGVDYVQDYR